MDEQTISGGTSAPGPGPSWMITARTWRGLMERKYHDNETDAIAQATEWHRRGAQVQMKRPGDVTELPWTPPASPSDEMLTTAQAAAELEVSDRRVRALISSGQLHAQKVGRDHLIRRGDLEQVRDRKPGRPRRAPHGTLRTTDAWPLRRDEYEGIALGQDGGDHDLLAMASEVADAAVVRGRYAYACEDDALRGTSAAIAWRKGGAD